ncbi:MAG TPA: ClbS/DfsB family four-helix bundle protein [Ktedonobacteraceae bacterium]|jgi:hypothetical protein|nr:ClbS/DfsB family four-helix bundle protein [Ktedonobacteraceae bacterium]
MTHRAFKPLLLDLLRQAQINQNAFFQQLPTSELESTGTPERWSAKDHVAHMTFWRQRLVSRLQAILREDAQPEKENKENFEELNPLIFEEHRHRPWSVLLSESDQVYAELIELVSQLTESDLTDSHRFDWINDGMPLYTTFMGNCYEHTQSHLAQYLLEHRDLKHALEMYEGWVNRVIELEVPETLKGYVLYNLACFYATHSQLEQARPALQQAFALYPATREFALTDPDLVALRPLFCD